MVSNTTAQVIMNKLLLLCLFLSIIVAFSDAEDQSQEQSVVQLSNSRLVREAEPKKKNKNKKNIKKRKRNKKKTKKNKKSKKATRKNKDKKDGNKNKAKKNKAKKRQRKTSRQSCMKDECLANATSHINILRKKIYNFKKQKARIESSMKQAASKGKKLKNFAHLIDRIREAGGGNSSNLTCNGATGPGADKFMNLTAELTACEGAINKSCVADLPTFNSTAGDKCSEYISAFENLTDSAMALTGEAACKIWEGSNITMAQEKVKDCDISKENGKFTSQKSKCTKTFGACRKLVGSAREALSACSAVNSKDNVVAAITAGVANQAAAATLSSIIAAATASRSTSNTSCADFITKVNEVTALTKTCPLCSDLATKLKAVSDLVVSPCSSDEKTSLTTAGTAFAEAAADIATAIEAKQMDLMISTGSTVSTSSLATTASSSRANKMAMRSAMEKFLRRSKA